jgi:putative SOS response-associated peptidase YedK
MCGRFIQISNPERVKVYFSESEVADEVKERFQENYNIAPTQDILTVLNTPKPRLSFTHWGLVPHWAKEKKMGNLMINARVETLSKKPSFREPFRRHRCIIPAMGFYEWDSVRKTRTPYFIKSKSGEPFAFAGLWDHWTDTETGKILLSSTIITTDANQLIAQIHTRMPVILTPDHYKLWLSSNPEPEAVLLECLKRYAAEDMETYEISKQVNNPRNNFPELIDPV